MTAYEPFSEQLVIRTKAVHQLAHWAHDRWLNAEQSTDGPTSTCKALGDLDTHNLNVTINLMLLGSALTLVWDKFRGEFEKRAPDSPLSELNIFKNDSVIEMARRSAKTPVRYVLDIIRNAIAHGGVSFERVGDEIQSIKFSNESIPSVFYVSTPRIDGTNEAIRVIAERTKASPTHRVRMEGKIGNWKKICIEPIRPGEDTSDSSRRTNEIDMSVKDLEELALLWFDIAREVAQSRTSASPHSTD